MNQLTIKELFYQDLLEELNSFHWPAVPEVSALLTVLTACESISPSGESLNFYPIYEAFYKKFKACVATDSRAMDVARPVFLKGSDEQAAPDQLGVDPPNQSRWKLTEDIFVDVPSTYTEGLAAACLYLLLRDASSSFENFANGRSDIAAEIPCLLEMIAHSELQDTNNESIFGEYLGLVRISFHPDFLAPGCSYRRETQKFDFRITQMSADRAGNTGACVGQKEVGISVKSINFRKPKFFASSSSHLEPNYEEQNCTKRKRLKKTEEPEGLKFVTKDVGENILLHNCDCSACKTTPIQKVEKASSGTITGLNCESKEKFTEALRSLKFGVVYLVHADLYFELRYALCTFNQEKFRGRKFKLRDFCFAKLPSCAKDPKVPRYSSSNGLVRIPTVIDLSAE